MAAEFVRIFLGPDGAEAWSAIEDERRRRSGISSAAILLVAPTA
jgi:hypothetical protein